MVGFPAVGFFGGRGLGIKGLGAQVLGPSRAYRLPVLSVVGALRLHWAYTLNPKPQTVPTP